MVRISSPEGVNRASRSNLGAVAAGIYPRRCVEANAARTGAKTSGRRENLVVHRGEHCLTVLNRYPYNNGHLLVAPQQHQGQPDELSDEETLELQQTIHRMIGLMRQLLGADGFNIGLNLGRAAGAGLPGHLHWHIVPRWNGDTNFMPVMAGVDVISQSLDALWEALDEAIRGE